MTRILKWAAVGVASLLTAAVTALWIIPHVVDLRHFKTPVEEYVRRATGRAFTAGGEVRLSLIPRCTLSFSELALGNPEGFDEPHLLTVESAEVRLKLRPLLFARELAVEGIVVRRPAIHLVTAADGRTSWDFAARSPGGGRVAPEAVPGGKPAPAGLPIRSPRIDAVRLEKGRVVVIDHRSGSRREITDLDLTLRDLALDRPVQVALAAAWEGRPLALQGVVGPFSGAAATPLALKATACDTAALELSGALYDLPAAPRLEAALALAEFSPRRLLAALGLPAPPTADPAALERLALRGTLRADGRSLHLAAEELSLDDTRARLAATLRDFARPVVAFELAVDRIDLDRYLPPPKAGRPEPGESGAGGKTTEGPAHPAPASAAPRLAIEGDLSVGWLKAAGAVLEELTLHVVGRGGLYTVDPLALRLYGGKAGGRVVVDLKGAAPAATLGLTAEGVRIHPLLKDLAGQEALEGTGRAALDIAFTGDSAAAVKRSLTGRGELLVSDGALIGFDLADMAHGIKSALTGKAASAGGRPRTEFSELKVPFTLRDGLFHTEESHLQSPLLRVQASGRADLARERLDFRLTPRLVGAPKGPGETREGRGELEVPLRVTGTFAAPEIRPDLKSLVREELQGIIAPEEEGGGRRPLTPSGIIKRLLPSRP